MDKRTSGTIFLHTTPKADKISTMNEKTVDAAQGEQPQVDSAGTGTATDLSNAAATTTATTAVVPVSPEGASENVAVLPKPKGKKAAIAKIKKVKKRPKKKPITPSDSSSSDSSSSESETSSSDSDDESLKKRSRKGKKAKSGRRGKGKKGKEDSDSDSSDGSSSSDDEGDRKAVKEIARKIKKLKTKEKALKAKNDSSSSSNSDTETSEDESTKKSKSKSKKKRKARKSKEDSAQDSASHDSTQNPNRRRRLIRQSTGSSNAPKPSAKQLKKEAKAAKKAEAKRKKLKGTKLEFVRVDRLWDYDKHAYITRETRADTESGEYDEFVFNVRRIFNWENKHISTVVDIKSKPLKEALIKVMGIVKGISLAEDTPTIDPHMIFLYLEELRVYMNQLKAKARAKRKQKKIAKQLTIKRKALKVLIKYLDKDYDETKKTLYPMLESGTITFDLLWALFKSNDVVYAPTYNTEEVPRAFKVEYATLEKSLVKGEFYEVEGKYLDYNGTTFGKADCTYTVEHFKGPRKISSLSCYPIKFHRNHDALREKMIARGKDFVALTGMLYKFQKGMAFYKKPNGQVVKVNVDGRVMVDPANFRRINPNYCVSTVKAEDPDLLPEDDSCCSSEDEEEDIDTDEESDNNQFDQFQMREKDIQKVRKKLVKDSDDDDELYVVEVLEEPKGNEIEALGGENEVDPAKFSDEEYLTASPVVLGFSFGHKMWMEFDIAGLKEIQWDEGAFDSLVIPHDQKDVVRALVESHSYSASKNIDDVIQGKGQGLVAVLHGPPGTGKTLTAEGIAELLKKPLYMVSVGELGIRGSDLERNFGQIIDIAHCWGALLLLDEADVFLEKRELHDISRNALVSIFLRMLEYFKVSLLSRLSILLLLHHRNKFRQD